jgi:prepilin-type N-terminal cleavage/methylation domain-containing protein
MKRSAFTLVELLVVAAVIALLAAILITAVNAARETARRTQCIARQRDLAIAMIAYSKEYNGLPGCLNQLGSTPLHSWAVAVFPLIGETKRYEVLMKEPSTVNADEMRRATASLPSLLCPSDRKDGIAPLNYIVNCGPVAETDITGDVASIFTLFKDRRSSLTSINKKVKIEEIPNGASNTILLSENVDAGAWYANGTDYAPDELELDLSVTSIPTYTRSRNAVRDLGFIWSPRADAQYAPNSSASGPRPSSKHPATVVMAYADGSAKAISDDIDIREYLRAVCVDTEKAVKPIGGLNLQL